MTDQLTPETPALFVPPAARNLPLAALDSATEGADRLDASARAPYGRNLIAHALTQLARDGWLRTEPGEGFDPQDGPHAPHAPQDGPERPDVGAETPDGPGGRQTGADGREAYRQLLARLQQERAKSLRNAPRCSLPDARWVNEGIAAGIRIAEAWAITLFEGHAARQAYLAAENGELSTAGRTTPDNPATSGDTADNPLRDQLRTALRRFIDPDDDRMPALADDGHGFTWVSTDSVLDELMAVIEGARDREREQLHADLDDVQHLYRLRTEQWRRVLHSRQRVEELCRQLAAALTEVLAAPRIPDSGGETAVRIGPVKCARVERWRKVLKAASQADGGPSVQEAVADDAAHWDNKHAGEQP